jgi:hypothetical protein
MLPCSPRRARMPPIEYPQRAGCLGAAGANLRSPAQMPHPALCLLYPAPFSYLIWGSASDRCYPSDQKTLFSPVLGLTDRHLRSAAHRTTTVREIPMTRLIMTVNQNINGSSSRKTIRSSLGDSSSRHMILPVRIPFTALCTKKALIMNTIMIAECPASNSKPLHPCSAESGYPLPNLCISHLKGGRR